MTDIETVDVKDEWEYWRSKRTVETIRTQLSEPIDGYDTAWASDDLYFLLGELDRAISVIECARTVANSTSPHSAPVEYVTKMNALRSKLAEYANGTRRLAGGG